VIKAGDRRDSASVAANVRTCLLDGHISSATPLVIYDQVGNAVSTFKVAVLELGKLDLDSYFGH
jgi:hypothetical protein